MRVLCLAALLLGAAAPQSNLDDFEDISGWRSAPSDGVSLNLSQAEGIRGRALRLDFDFHGGAGYAVARKELPFSLPDNYEISFQVRAEAPINNFEVKLIDPSNENVWWVNKRGFEFPRAWTEVRLKKRHIQFAWGPAGGGEIRNVAAIEFAVTAGTGGKGYVLLDELTLRELPPPHPYNRTPRVISSAEGISMDFLENREYGGLVIDWEPGAAVDYFAVEVSDDGENWRVLHRGERGIGDRNYLYLPETESRYLRIRISPPNVETPRGASPRRPTRMGRRHDRMAGGCSAAGGDAPRGVSTFAGTGVRNIDVKPLDWAPSIDAFFMAIAKDAPRGAYPRWLGNEQSYWTVVGAAGDTAEGLFNEDGMLETGKGGFSVEPFLEHEGRLVTWNDVRSTQALAEGYLPIPSVHWDTGTLALEITAYATGPTLRARYRLLNRGAAKARAKLILAIRPFQVNPSWQFLGTPPGGASPIQEISIEGATATVNDRKIIASVPPSASGAATFDEGPITEFLARGRLPERARVSDSFAYASAAMTWDLDLPGGETREIEIAVPLQQPSPRGEGSLDGAIASWHSELDRIDIELPAAPALVQTLKSTLAYILINQDGPAIQPGSRSYERSWIRDGALTATALLRLGHAEEVRSFLAWYAPYQFANGKVPCCVDSRGADPVPENDSHGELIHLAAQYFRFTNDRELIERLWPHVEGAVRYIDELRQQRRTPAYRTPEKLPYFGLLPESISHEGYSDKPVHSYWDDFFALRGLKDATELAGALGRKEQVESWAKMRDEFRTDFLASIRRTIALHKVDYLPASVEKGDFDPTSTSIGIAPGGELADLPQAPLRQTFERYYRESIARRDGTKKWDAYTPYELRTIRTLLRLGWRDRAHELLDFFMNDRRPAAWNQWAEVVWREPRNPKFIGDMPHTWVGSEFIHSFLDLLAYVRESDGALVIGDGLLPAWNELTVRGLRTEYGNLNYSVTPVGKGVRYRISGPAVPPGGVVARWQGKEEIIRGLPADVTIHP